MAMNITGEIFAPSKMSGTITNANITATMYPIVTFSVEQAQSGNYSNISDSFNGGVYVYSKTNASITIPSIECLQSL